MGLIWGPQTILIFGESVEQYAALHKGCARNRASISLSEMRGSALAMPFHLAGDLLVAGDVILVGEGGFDGSEFAGEGLIAEDVGVLEFTQAVVRKEIEVAIGDDRFESFLTHVSDETMLADIHADQIVDAVVGGDAGEVMNLVVRGDGFTTPCAIDSMGNETLFAIIPRMIKFPVPLLAIRIGSFFTVRS